MGKLITSIQIFYYALKARRLYHKYDKVQIEREGWLVAGNLWSEKYIYALRDFEVCHEEKLPKKFEAKLLDFFKLNEFPEKFHDQEALYALIQTTTQLIGRAPVMYAPDNGSIKCWIWSKAKNFF